jgi:hypothetical protein
MLPWATILLKRVLVATLLLVHVQPLLNNCVPVRLLNMHTKGRTATSPRGLDQHHLQVPVRADFYLTKKAGFPTQDEVLVLLNPTALILSTTKSLPNNHHRFLNNTCKVVASSLGLLKLAILAFVAIHLDTLLQPEHHPILLFGKGVRTRMSLTIARIAAARRQTKAMNWAMECRCLLRKGKGKELFQEKLLVVEGERGREDRVSLLH